MLLEKREQLLLMLVQRLLTSMSTLMDLSKMRTVVSRSRMVLI
jgi:hypothetical protein